MTALPLPRSGTQQARVCWMADRRTTSMRTTGAHDNWRTSAANADFRTATSALGSGEFEVELASVPPGDGGVGGEAGLAEDG